MRPGFLVFIFALLISAGITPTSMYAQNSVKCASVSACEDLISKYEKKLEDAKRKVGSLSKEIEVIESNIEIKEVQIIRSQKLIEDKTLELNKLQDEIGLLEVRLDRIGENIDTQKNLLDLRIKQQYKQTQKPLIEKLLSSRTLGSFVTQIKYMQIVQKEDRVLLSKMNVTKDNYEDQQKTLNEKREEVERVKKEIEFQKAESERLKAALEDQKESKDNLLSVTKNDEKNYKALIEAAKKELEQIQRAANVVIREGKGVEVKRGEVVGSMGNSGFSTGVHLHFGIYKYSEDDFQSKSQWSWYYSNYENPLKYLKEKTAVWQTGCKRDPQGSKPAGSGDWVWPVDSPRITQNYGSNTCYNWQYGGKPHPALDIGPPSKGLSVPIYAVDDGTAYFCRNCLGDGGNGVFIFHDDDRMSLYWHLR